MAMERSDNAAASIIFGIGGLGFALSYEALYTAAVSAGMSPTLSYGYPLIVEGFVTIATWTAYRLRDRGWKATAYPWTLAMLFFAFSLWANAMPESLLGPVVRGVPSVALGFAVHLFTQLRKRRSAEPVTIELPDADETEEPMDFAPWAEWELPARDAQAALISAPVFGAEKPRPSGVVAQVRSWAKSAGLEVKDTGRLPVNVYEAYEKAHTA
ncbi:DUF2637 domain-containing protein [Streptomyces sp. NPDC056230]|uniref:DUF2637 domain-containing protein n=1 Tax=Streptomyces sp. NPDC056230 TaxID=3345754 RepID=UPI0035D7C40A